MVKVRKRPIEVEAKQITLHNIKDVANWCNGDASSLNTRRLYIHTLEGTMNAEIGDWIIQGVKGEFYPCKPDIFKATYEILS